MFLDQLTRQFSPGLLVLESSTVQGNQGSRRNSEQSVAEGRTSILTGQGPAVTVPAMAPLSLLLWPAGSSRWAGPQGPRRLPPSASPGHAGQMQAVKPTVPLLHSWAP
jgi:hypothetical protein